MDREKAFKPNTDSNPPREAGRGIYQFVLDIGSLDAYSTGPVAPIRVVLQVVCASRC